MQEKFPTISYALDETRTHEADLGRRAGHSPSQHQGRRLYCTSINANSYKFFIRIPYFTRLPSIQHPPFPKSDPLILRVPSIQNG